MVESTFIRWLSGDEYSVCKEVPASELSSGDEILVWDGWRFYPTLASAEVNKFWSSLNPDSDPNVIHVHFFDDEDQERRILLLPEQNVYKVIRVRSKDPGFLSRLIRKFTFRQQTA